MCKYPNVQVCQCVSRYYTVSTRPMAIGHVSLLVLVTLFFWILEPMKFQVPYFGEKGGPAAIPQLVDHGIRRNFSGNSFHEYGRSRLPQPTSANEWLFQFSLFSPYISKSTLKVKFCPMCQMEMPTRCSSKQSDVDFQSIFGWNMCRFFWMSTITSNQNNNESIMISSATFYFT